MSSNSSRDLRFLEESSMGGMFAATQQRKKRNALVRCQSLRVVQAAEEEQGLKTPGVSLCWENTRRNISNSALPKPLLVAHWHVETSRTARCVVHDAYRSQDTRQYLKSRDFRVRLAGYGPNPTTLHDRSPRRSLDRHVQELS